MASTSDEADYYLFVSETGTRPNAWGWEIRRNSVPMGVRLSEGGFQSRQAAEFSGVHALSDFLIALGAEQRRLSGPRR
jgi:hypothetical protein